MIPIWGYAVKGYDIAKLRQKRGLKRDDKGVCLVNGQKKKRTGDKMSQVQYA